MAAGHVYSAAVPLLSMSDVRMFLDATSLLEGNSKALKDLSTMAE